MELRGIHRVTQAGKIKLGQMIPGSHGDKVSELFLMPNSIPVKSRDLDTGSSRNYLSLNSGERGGNPQSRACSSAKPVT